MLLDPVFGVAADMPSSSVCVSINPLAGIVRAVGGARLAVHVLIDSRVDPHTFELKPAHLKRVSEADLLVFNGLGLEYWAQGLRADYAEKLLEFGAAVGSTDSDPHIWLDPKLVQAFAPLLAERLCRLDQAACRDFQKNAEHFIEELVVLDRDIAAAVAGWNTKSFIAYHPAWTHFARRYGLRQAGEFKRSHASDITARSLRELVILARDQNVKVLFMEPLASLQQVKGLVEEAHLEVVSVDDLGQPGEDYVKMMRRNLAAMDTAFGGRA